VQNELKVGLFVDGQFDSSCATTVLNPPFPNPALMDFDDPDFDPLEMDDAAYADTPDPYPRLAELRHQNWVLPFAYRSIFTDVYDQSLGEFPHYTVFGYDKVFHFLTHSEIFSSKVFVHSLGKSFGKTIVAMDASEHTQYRRIFQKAFLPHVVRQWGESISSRASRSTIPSVDVAQGSANRDEAKFDDPNVFNIFRDRRTRHLAFGSGPHVCIGQHLAKVEMERALNAVLDTLPNIRLDPGSPPPDIRGFSMRKPKHLNVIFDS
jgi:cytochrome P450